MNLKQKLTATLGAAVLGGLAALPASAQGVFNIAVPDWTGGQVSCLLLAKVAEQELGYKVKHVQLPSGSATLEAMAAGDIDVGCELWPSYYPAKDEFFEKWGGNGTLEVVGEHGVIGRSTYFVPRYLVEGDGAPAPDLKKFTDLTKYKDLFKTIETGDMGRLIGCPALNWECMDQERADANGVPFKAVSLGSETAHWAEMQGAYKRKEAFVAYAWEPHWIHAELDLVALELDDNGDGSCWPQCGWPVDVTVNYARADFDEKYPELAKMVANSKLTNAQQNAMVYEIDIKGRDLDEVVDEWMAANEDVWKAWAK